jgi:hypothetical protein
LFSNAFTIAVKLSPEDNAAETARTGGEGPRDILLAEKVVQIEHALTRVIEPRRGPAW